MIERQSADWLRRCHSQKYDDSSTTGVDEVRRAIAPDNNLTYMLRRVFSVIVHEDIDQF